MDDQQPQEAQAEQPQQLPQAGHEAQQAPYEHHEAYQQQQQHPHYEQQQYQQQYQQQQYQQYQQQQQQQAQYYSYDASHSHYPPQHLPHHPYASPHAASAYPSTPYPPSAYPPAHSYQPSPPPAYPPAQDSAFSAPSPLAAFFDPREPPPAAVAPPAREEVRGRVEKAAEYAAKNGPQFEALMRDKQRGHPTYGFLEPGGEGADYYRFRLWCALSGAGGADAAKWGEGKSGADGEAESGGGNQGEKGGERGNVEGKVEGVQEGGKEAAEGAVGAHQAQPGSEAPAAAHPSADSAPPLPPQPPTAPQEAEADMALRAAVAAAGLPLDVGGEAVATLAGLSGTKDAIKSAKAWVAWRGAMGWAPHIAWVLRERMAALSGQPERQLHVIYLVNDVLFHSLQQRPQPSAVDAVAGALQPCLGFMLAALFHGGGQQQSSNQERLGKILAFWATKEVYPGEVMAHLGALMRLPPHQHAPMPPPPPPGPPLPAATPLDYHGAVPYPSAPLPYAHRAAMPHHAPPPPAWPPHPPHMPPMPHDAAAPASAPVAANPPPFSPSPAPATHPAHLPSLSPAAPSAPAQPQPPTSDAAPAAPAPPPAEKPPYPLFPPGLIPGMVRKKQVGSGVPYAPMAPHDIPSSIPPPHESEEYLRRRIAKFFRAIGEKDPMADGQEEEEEPDEVDGGRGILGAGIGNRVHGHGGGGLGGGGRRGSGAKPRALSPPPAMGMEGGGLGLGMEVDPETGMLPDGSVVQKPGMGGARLGLGAAVEADAPSQYDDVYSSFRRMLSSSYHTSISERAARKYER
ncbi:hypothetical protein CLOM_g10076 [Closterium sp. NIES-68]|nr:hypothetical protein CLOM_g10076 [Closterium sp. NIES-68]GJP63148.1 hypothetical protein CLOP_g20223 [Closterium sp. NIES-67]